MGTFLIIRSLIDGDMERFHAVAYITLLMYGFVFVAAVIDMILGISKAHRKNQKVTSRRLMRTIIKLLKYFGLLTFGVMIDFIISPYYSKPLAMSFFTLFVVFIEFKSYFEKMRKDNEDMDGLPDAIIALLKDSDLGDALMKALIKKGDKKGEV